MVKATLYQADSIYRVLNEQNDLILVIDCIKLGMPRWISQKQLNEVSECTEEILRAKATIDIRDNLNIEEEGVCNKRFTIIADILPFIGDQSQRNTAIAKSAKENRLTTKTIRNMLCKYLAFQDKRVFVPAAPKIKGTDPR